MLQFYQFRYQCGLHGPTTSDKLQTRLLEQFKNLWEALGHSVALYVTTLKDTGHT
jgi:hypothetical protein